MAADVPLWRVPSAFLRQIALAAPASNGRPGSSVLCGVRTGERERAGVRGTDCCLGLDNGSEESVRL